MAIGKDIQRAVIAAARQHRMEPAALLAVVEIESAGKLFEDDGRTPRLLFERHVFYRELNKRAPDKLAAAIAAGLAIPKWSRATQYKDQATSKGRLNVLARARAIDFDCANRSASFGLGQTMGFNAEGLGFANASDMVAFMERGGIAAQVDCMVREIKRNKLERALAQKNWAAFARGYNGPGYAANQYDTKLAAAYRKWLAALDPGDPETGDEPVDLPMTRAAEPPPMTSSTIGNGAIVTGGAATTGGGLLIADRLLDKAIDKSGDVADQVVDTATRAALTWPLIGGCALIAIAVAVCGVIWWKRYRLKQDAGV